jgi:hypothetical protein
MNQVFPQKSTSPSAYKLVPYLPPQHNFRQGSQDFLGHPSVILGQRRPAPANNKAGQA